MRENVTDNFIFQDKAFKDLKDPLKKFTIKKHYVHYLDYMCQFWSMADMQKESRLVNMQAMGKRGFFQLCLVLWVSKSKNQCNKHRNHYFNAGL